MLFKIRKTVNKDTLQILVEHFFSNILLQTPILPETTAIQQKFFTEKKKQPLLATH